MSSIFNEVEGEVKIPLKQYHYLQGKIKELKEEADNATEDSKVVLKKLQDLTDATNLVSQFLTSMYKSNKTYVKDQVAKFNQTTDVGVLLIDKENERITIQVNEKDS